VWEAKPIGEMQALEAESSQLPERVEESATFATSLLGGDVEPTSLRSDLDFEEVFELLLGPVAGAAARGEIVGGVVAIHLDDADVTGTEDFVDEVVAGLRSESKVSSEDTNGTLFVVQRDTWIDRLSKGRTACG
jgi:hypothetical protein